MKVKHTIGRTDMVDLPELGINNVNAKIDTGAYTSSLHCDKIEEKDGKLSFLVHLELDGKKIKSRFETTNYKQKAVKSSNGVAQLRYVIKTKILLFGKAYTTEFSLTDRSSMKNPILIGRKLLKNRFLVDVACENLSFENKKLT